MNATSRLRKSYDAIVVGSGATGGWVAKELTEGGMDVLVLDAGRMPTIAGDVRPRRASAHPWRPDRQAVQSRSDLYGGDSHHFYVDDVDDPYVVPPAKPFHWIRGRQVGGRTHVWARQVYRLSDRELLAASRDGFGEDWPIRSAELAPAYDAVESFLGVHGARDGLPHLPDPISFVCRRTFEFDAALAESLGAGRVVKSRFVVERRPERASPCPYCGRSARSCPPFFTSTSLGSTLHAAARTGRLALRPDAVASHVLVDPRSGRASGVRFFDRTTRRDREISARIVFLCASTIESVRLLLNSATRQHPGGLANSSGTLGHGLMDHQLAIARGMRRSPRRGRHEGTILGYVPPAPESKRRAADFLRGFALEIANHALGDEQAVGIRAYGEVLAKRRNRVTLDGSVVDAYGIPAARIDCAYSENERRMGREMLAAIVELAQATHTRLESSALAPPGLSIHELGGARMGAKRRTSVLDPFCRSWDVQNLFVPDGAAFPSSGYQNPTLTMMALARRAARHALDECRRGNL